ncbi:MAG: hypothetical protein Q9217_003221 [Psora testacea]
MPLPQPKVPLKDHCSIIYKNKLYAYQSDAFQALDLTEGGQWTQLPMGLSTTGSACVQGSVDDEPAFIVVGGSTQQQGYNGLQHYSFQSNSWKSVKPADGVVANRRRHGAAFLQESSQILTYGGSQDNDSSASSQTFIISTEWPYSTQAHSSTAPAVSDPLLLPYNTSHALMLGGNPTNTKLYTFSPSAGWHQLEVSLQNGMKDSTKMQATIFHGSHGTKLLEIFDMSTSPNQIKTVLLQNATNTSDRTRARSYVSSPHQPAKRRKRDTSLAHRPAYNNTLAPQDTRTGFSLASDLETGLVVATGGNSQAPMAIFNETGNQWIDPNQFFEAEPSPTLSPSSTSSTPPPTAVPSAPVTANHSARDRSLTILAGILGGVLGAALLLVLLLLLLRHIRRRKQQEEAKRNNYPLEQKQEMDFTDIGADFMKEAGGSNVGSAHRRNKSDNSVTHQDRSGATTSQSKRALLHAKGDSGGSRHSIWRRGTKSPEKKSPPQISAPIMAGASLTGSMRASPESRPADSGWSRYFANNNNNVQEMLSKPTPRAEETRPVSYVSNDPSQSDYGSSHIPSSHPHESAEVEPLNFRPSQFDVPPNVHAVSPTDFSPQPGLGVALTHGTSRKPPAESLTPSVVSDIEEEDDYCHSNGQDSWTPVESGGERDSHWTDDRPGSSYSNSLVYPHPGERVRIPKFPMPNAGNSTTTSPIASQSQNEQARGLRNVVSRDLMRSNSQRQRATDIVRTGTQRVTPTTAPTVRTFPRRPEQLGPRGRGSSEREDMSWLNLGTNAEQQRNHPYYPPH